VSSTPDGWIHVHIADPTRMIAPKSVLDLWSRSRGTSLYSPEGKVSMLPLNIAAGPMSLHHGDHVNSCLTFSAKLDFEGKIEKFDVNLTHVNNMTRANYEQVETALDIVAGKDEKMPRNLNNRKASDLARLHHWAKLRKEYRKSKGAKEIFLPKQTPIVKDNKFVQLETDQSLSVPQATCLVSELMITAGEVAYLQSKKHGLPVPFRVQEAPTRTVDCSDIPREGQYGRILNDLRRVETMSPAYNSTDDIGHFSIGVDGYCRTTSPIRRYMDCLVHYQLKSTLNGETPPFTKQELDNIIPYVNMSETLARNYQRNSAKFWLRSALRSRIGQDFLAVVYSTELSVEDRLQVYIPSLQIKTFVTSWYIPVGTEMVVRLRDVGIHAPQFSTSPVSVLQFKQSKEIN